MCQHHFHCWFGSQCRGWHTDKEEAHFAKCDLMAQGLGVQLEAVRVEQDAVAPHELVEDIFYDTVLAPRRRLHRRLRKKQWARVRRNNRVEFKVFRRAQRCLETSHRTHSVMTQTQPELNSRARGTQTHYSIADSDNTSAMEKEERIQVDAIAQTQSVCCK